MNELKSGIVRKSLVSIPATWKGNHSMIEPRTPDFQSHFYMGLIGTAFGFLSAWAMPTILPALSISGRSKDPEMMKSRVTLYRFLALVVGLGSLAMAISNFEYR